MTLHIVGNDGTDRGDDATVLAGRLAGLYDARLVAVPVMGLPPVRNRFSGPVPDRLEQEAAGVLVRAQALVPGLETRVVFARSAAATLASR